MRILIVHPEGNISNNLNLYAMVKELCERDFQVDYIAWKREGVPQKPYFEKLRFFKARRCRFSRYCLFSNTLMSKVNFFVTLFMKCFRYSFIIGVDDGIIPASELSKKFNIPYALISYEIFPCGECENKEEKKSEVMSCKNIEFAVTQDDERAILLSKENRIPIEKIIRIPLGGLGAKKLVKNHFLHEELGIDKNRKIALVMGSIAEWSMIYKIIKDMAFWNDEWVLVVHGRYGRNPLISKLKEDNNRNNKIFFSEIPVDTCEEMDKILSSVSIGLALYKPAYNSKWDGLNLEKIGMSSGKIATFLRHGIPVIVNDIGEMSQNIIKYDLGKLLIEGDKLEINILEDEIAQFSLNCLDFYEKHLSIKVTCEEFFRRLENITAINHC
jgi:O-antigen biosynthesis protein